MSAVEYKFEVKRIMISVNQLLVRFGSFELFKNVTFMINPRDRIGLVGRNGAGKSTLLKVFMGIEQADEGRVTVPAGVSLGYLAQQIKPDDGRTVIDEAKLAFAEVMNLKKEIDQMNEEIANRTDYESDTYLNLIDRLTEANERYDLLGGTNSGALAEQTLIGLGFERGDLHRQTTEFSGGWRMRIELAKILLQRPDVLLLDEPTNHLDIESIQWLEDFLKDYQGAVVLISHDRAFLDAVTNRTVEISLGKINDYKVQYSKYVVLRKERREQQLAAYINQQKMIEEIERFIERFRYKASKAVQVQSRVKQLEKIERLEVDEEDNSTVLFRFPPAPRSGDIALEGKELQKKYGDNTVFSDLDFVIERGEKVALVGRNGEGKTTLSKMIMREIEHEGHLKIGHNVRIGYYAQNQEDVMDGTKTVFQTLDDVAVGNVRIQLKNILGSFLFRGEDIDKKVSILSGGERSRLALSRLLLEPYSLLLLDEPTNHLDMRSKDILKQALKQYDGTLIVVSHDRDFLDGLVDKVYEFRNKRVKEHLGGIYDFLRKKKLENLKEIERKEIIKKGENQEKTTSDNKQLYLLRKEHEKKVRKVKGKVKKSEEKIDELESKIAAYDKTLAAPENTVLDTDFYAGYESLKAELETEMENWEAMNSDLDKIKQLTINNYRPQK